MFKDPYETTIGKRFPGALKAVPLIQLAKINKQLLSKELNFPEDRAIFAVGPDNTNIPQFKHPLYIEDYVVIDARTMVRKTSAQGEYTIKAKTEFDFDVCRALLGLYANEKGNAAVGYNLFGMTVFRTWITNTLVKAKGLSYADAGNQLKLMIITSFYYHTLFHYDTNNAQYSKTEQENTARLITTSMGNTRLYDEVLLLISELKPMHSIEDLCTNIEQHCGVRLQGFNVPTLYTYLRGAWFGDAELVAVSLESIPTFLAMVYFGIENRYYHKTGIGVIAQEVNRRGTGEEFVRSMKKLPIFY